MRRLLALLAGLLGFGGVAACHNPGSAWNECYANRPHSGDNMQYNSAATFSFGVYSCRVHHSGGYTGTYHTFCMYPDAHTKFQCTGPAGLLFEDVTEEGDTLLVTLVDKAAVVEGW